MHVSVSWPSVKTSASTIIESPAMRFTGKRPPSISGMTRSMTARPRPSPAPQRTGFEAAFDALAFMLEIQDGKRRQCYAYSMIPAVGRDRMGFDAAIIPHAAAAVERGVGVERFLPVAGPRHAQQVIFARH